MLPNVSRVEENKNRVKKSNGAYTYFLVPALQKKKKHFWIARNTYFKPK